jgi:hypothetical protein
MSNDSNNVGNPPDSGDAVGERKKEVKTGQQSVGGGDDNVGRDGPKFLMRTEIMKEAKMFAMTPTMLACFVMLTMVMETTLMALLTILVTMTATMLVNHLPVVTLSVKEKKK